MNAAKSRKERYVAGVTIDHIAAQNGTSRQFVQRSLQRQGIRFHRPSDAALHRLSCYLNGIEIKELAESEGIRPKTLRTQLNRTVRWVAQNGQEVPVTKSLLDHNPHQRFARRRPTEQTTDLEYRILARLREGATQKQVMKEFKVSSVVPTRLIRKYGDSYPGLVSGIHRRLGRDTLEIKQRWSQNKDPIVELYLANTPLSEISEKYGISTTSLRHLIGQHLGIEIVEPASLISQHRKAYQKIKQNHLKEILQDRLLGRSMEDLAEKHQIPVQSIIGLQTEAGHAYPELRLKLTEMLLRRRTASHNRLLKRLLIAHNDGTSIEQLAKQEDCSLSRIRQLLPKARIRFPFLAGPDKRAVLRKRRDNIRKNHLKELLERYQRNEGYRNLIVAYDISTGALSGLLEEARKKYPEMVTKPRQKREQGQTRNLRQNHLPGILEDYYNGRTLNEMAESYGIGKSTVYRLVQEAKKKHPDLVVQGKARRSQKTRQLLTDYNTGIEVSRLAEQENTSRNSIYRRLDMARKLHPNLALLKPIAHPDEVLKEILHSWEENHSISDMILIHKRSNLTIHELLRQAHQRFPELVKRPLPIIRRRKPVGQVLAEQASEKAVEKPETVAPTAGTEPAKPVAPKPRPQITPAIPEAAEPIPVFPRPPRPTSEPKPEPSKGIFTGILSFFSRTRKL